MIREQAIIIASDENTLTAKVDRKGTCEACKLKSGCGQKVMNDLTSKSCIEFDLDNTLGAQSGDMVELAIPEKALLTASLIMYLLPLCLMILGALAADAMFVPAGESHEGASIIGAIAGLAIGFLCAAQYSKLTKKSHFQPSLVSILSKNVNQ